MNYPTTCQFCHAPITIEIDDEYGQTPGDVKQGPLGDPYKLLKYATCNPCADLRVKRRKLESTIKHCCSLLELLPVSESKKRQALRAILERITKEYSKLIAAWHRTEVDLWEPAIMDQLMKHPDKWDETIGRMWRSFREWKRQQSPALPYKDT